MSQLSRTSFKGSYGTNGVIFPDNTTGEISEADMRGFGENLADSFVNKTDDVIDDDTFATASPNTVPTSESVKAYVEQYVLVTSSTGTAVKFDTPRTYGYSTAETGNITLDSTGLIEGMVQLLIHNDSSEPTFGSEFKIISGAYAANEDNYIFMLAVKSNLILVTITQEI